MPLADERVGIAGLFQPFGNGNVVKRKVLDHIGRAKGRTFRLEPALITRVVGQRQSSRRLTGHDGGTRRRTDRRRRIAIGETHAFGSQPIDIRGLQQAVPLAVEISPSQVIDHNKQNIRPTLGRGRCGSSDSGTITGHHRTGQGPSRSFNECASIQEPFLSSIPT